MTADNVLFEIKGLKKNFGDLEVLKGIHTTIRKGEVVVVIGPSGSGKSTFIRCLNLLETPTEGQIIFEGSCITDKGYAVHKHREKVGMVFQQFNLFNNLTILENVTISLKKVKKVPAPAAEEKARALLRRVGLEDKADAYPAQLSGGQKQRIAIVRAMAMEPDVMLFDEPTSALDPEMVGGGALGHSGPRKGGRHHGCGHPRDGLRQKGGDPHPLYGRRRDRRGGHAPADL